jgi:diguanylate cyclase (GGDEF)-like protein
MAFIGLVALLPIFGIIAILIKRDSPGPVFFWGSRMGKGGRVFKMLKFRTMHERPESYQGPRVTAQGDDRITPLGHWLRDTKINELPQLWNVLIGEMSLVGPRPEDPEIAKTWPADASAEILSVRPGVTSPASILYHDEERMLSKANLMGDYFMNILPDKMRLDRLYVRYRSFFSDIDTIFWTLAILIPYWAQTGIPEGYIFGGPFSRFIHRYVTWFMRDVLVSLGAIATTILFWPAPLAFDWWMGVSVVAIAFLFSSTNSLFGSNKVVWHRAKAGDAVTLLFASFVGLALVLAINQLKILFKFLPYPEFSPAMLVMAGLMAQFGFIAVRYQGRLFSSVASRWVNWRQDSAVLGERVVIVGSGEAVQIANWLLRRPMFRTSFSMVGIVDDNNPTNYGLRVDGSWMLGGVTDLPKIIERYDVGIILSTLPQRTPETKYMLDLCDKANMRLLFLSDLMWLVDRQVTQPVGKLEHAELLDERLERQVMHDSLTELPTQTLFEDRLRRSVSYAKRYHTQRAVMFIELDGIAAVQDVFNRKDLLKEAARRLSECTRESDTLARFQKDNFALLLENIPEYEHADVVVDKIASVIAQPFYIRGQPVNLGIQVRVCLCNGKSCATAESPENIDVRKCYECAVIKKQKPRELEE